MMEVELNPKAKGRDNPLNTITPNPARELREIHVPWSVFRINFIVLHVKAGLGV